MKRILLILLLPFTQVALAEVPSPDVAKFFLSYVQALKSGDSPGALGYWSLLDRTFADQLGIKYLNTPVKLEGGSLLTSYIGQLKSGTADLVIDTITANRGFAKISYHIKTKDTTVNGFYFAVTTSTVEPSLTTPMRVFTESWDQAQSRFVMLTYRDLSLLEQSNIDETDQFIEQTARIIGISKEKMDALERTKFRVVLCESYGEVQQISGKTTLGHFVKPLDVVVSKYFPAYHEIAEFLVSYANDSLSLYTFPFIEHGTATFLGGRWGRSAPVMLSLGSYIYSNNLMELDKLLTAPEFMSYENNSDFSYPLAGLFCKFLFEKLGREKYFQLYRQLSGSEDEVNAITPQRFKDLVNQSTGAAWSSLDSEFKEYARNEGYAGIAAGSHDQGKQVYESGLPDMTVRILEDSTHYNFLIRAKSGDPKAALVAGEHSNKAEPFRSFLFEEYFPEATYDHQRWAVIFSDKEVGAYDFFTNVITGKYIVGFTAAEEIVNSGSNEYRFRIEKRLLPDFPKQGLKIIPMK